MDLSTKYYKVESIDGDYAHLKDAVSMSTDEKLVARALLPPEIREGTMLKYEMLKYEIIM